MVDRILWSRENHLFQLHGLAIYYYIESSIIGTWLSIQIRFPRLISARKVSAVVNTITEHTNLLVYETMISIPDLTGIEIRRIPTGQSPYPEFTAGNTPVTNDSSWQNDKEFSSWIWGISLLTIYPQFGTPQEHPHAPSDFPVWFVEYSSVASASYTTTEGNHGSSLEPEGPFTSPILTEGSNSDQSLGRTGKSATPESPLLTTWSLRTQRKFFQANWMDTPREFQFKEFTISYKLEGCIYDAWISIRLNIPPKTDPITVTTVLNHITSDTEGLIRDILHTNPHAERLEILRRAIDGEQLDDPAFTALNTPISTHWGWLNAPGYSSWLNITITHPSREADLDEAPTNSDEDG
jgi:hypothetical protein